MGGTVTPYIPERNHIVWVDFEPSRGREIGKYRQALVLSPQAYQTRLGLMICCPISTSIRGGPLEVGVHNLFRPSVVAASLVHTLCWKDRHVKYAVHAEDGLLEAVLERLGPLMGFDTLLSS